MSHVFSWVSLMKSVIFLLLLVSFCYAALANKIRPNHVRNEPFKSRIDPISKKIQLKMQRYNVQQGCPIPLSELATVKLSYWGFDKKPHVGVLIVNKALAEEVVEIFKVLYLKKFPIERMELMDTFNHDDDAAMDANNTSAFNCRVVTGEPGLLSQHSYGRAIDINPLINPYVKGSLILPSKGAQFKSREQPCLGKITKNSLIYHEFIKRGWDWGGGWYDVQDYQHFEKQANGVRRNPHGH